MTSTNSLSERLDELEQSDDSAPETLAQAIIEYHEKNDL